jgi:hypothetical protein
MSVILQYNHTSDQNLEQKKKDEKKIQKRKKKERVASLIL